MNSRQRQRGGQASQQIQVAGDLVVLEFDEERATEIAREQAELVIQEFTAEAEIVAFERIDNFSQRLIGDLAALDLLNVFADPAFQILLKKTQLHAAATAEDSDHELLSKLLSERATGHSKPMHMVITRAVEVVEQIDSMALRGMLFLWFASKISPSDADPKSGFARLDSMAAKLSEGEELPTGTGWLQRLDLMGCIRYSPPGLQSMYKWHDILLKTTPGYACEGIPSSDVNAVRVKLDRILPNLGSVIGQHPFLPGYSRINTISSARLIEDLRPNMQTLDEFKAKLPLAAMTLPNIDSPLRALGSREDLQAVLIEARVDDINADATANMLDYIKTAFPNLERMRSWWDSIQGIVGITPVGTAIAYSNARRFDQLASIAPLSEVIED